MKIIKMKILMINKLIKNKHKVKENNKNNKFQK